jgi:hypothetical protein
MNKVKPIWVVACGMSGLVLGQLLGHFYGGKVIPVCLGVLFALLIGLSLWAQKEKNGKNNDEDSD